MNLFILYRNEGFIVYIKSWESIFRKKESYYFVTLSFSKKDHVIKYFLWSHDSASLSKSEGSTFDVMNGPPKLIKYGVACLRKMYQCICITSHDSCKPQRNYSTMYSVALYWIKAFRPYSMKCFFLIVCLHLGFKIRNHHNLCIKGGFHSL